MDGTLVLSRKEAQGITLYKDGVNLGTITCRNRDVLMCCLDKSVTVLRTEITKRPDRVSELQEPTDERIVDGIEPN